MSLFFILVFLQPMNPSIVNNIKGRKCNIFYKYKTNSHCDSLILWFSYWILLNLLKPWISSKDGWFPPFSKFTHWHNLHIGHQQPSNNFGMHLFEPNKNVNTRKMKYTCVMCLYLHSLFNNKHSWEYKLLTKFTRHQDTPKFSNIAQIYILLCKIKLQVSENVTLLRDILVKFTHLGVSSQIL